MAVIVVTMWSKLVLLSSVSSLHASSYLSTLSVIVVDTYLLPDKLWIEIQTKIHKFTDILTQTKIHIHGDIQRHTGTHRLKQTCTGLQAYKMHKNIHTYKITYPKTHIKTQNNLYYIHKDTYVKSVPILHVVQLGIKCWKQIQFSELCWPDKWGWEKGQPIWTDPFMNESWLMGQVWNFFFKCEIFLILLFFSSTILKSHVSRDESTLGDWEGLWNWCCVEANYRAVVSALSEDNTLVDLPSSFDLHYKIWPCTFIRFWDCLFCQQDFFYWS